MDGCTFHPQIKGFPDDSRIDQESYTVATPAKKNINAVSSLYMESPPID